MGGGGQVFADTLRTTQGCQHILCPGQTTDKGEDRCVCVTLGRFVTTTALDHSDPKERKSTSPEPDPSSGGAGGGGGGGGGRTGWWIGGEHNSAE